MSTRTYRSLSAIALGLPVLIACTAIAGIFSGRPTTWEELGGISVGEPKAARNGVVKVPIKFENPYWERHAASLPPKVHRVSSRVDGTTITFWVTLASGIGGGDGAPKEIVVRPRRGGLHVVSYRDPDGTLHKAGIVDLEVGRDSSPRSSIGR